MKSSIQKKLTLLYLFAISIVVLTGVISFYYLYKLGNDIGEQMSRDIALVQNLEKIQEKLVNINEIGNELVYFKDNPRIQSLFIQEVAALKVHLKTSQTNALKEENRQHHERLINLLTSYQEVILSQSETGAENRKKVMQDIREVANELLESKTSELALHKVETNRLLSNAQRNLILILIVVIAAGIIIATIVPHRIALPFRKFIYALHEIENGNLNVRLPEKGEGEIVAMQKSFNDAMKHLAMIEEMRIRKINFEKRRFSVLSDMVDLAVVLLSVEGKIVHLNNQFFDVFHITSDDVINRGIEEGSLPDSFKALLHTIIDHSERFQNMDYKLQVRRKDGTILEREVWVDASPVKNHTGAIVNWVITMEDKDRASKNRLFCKI